MSEYDDTNRGVLFKNDKDGNEKRPDYKGSINADGRDFQLSAWIRTSKKGVTYMSLSVEAKEENRQPPQQQPPAQKHESTGKYAETGDAGEGDDIPF